MVDAVSSPAGFLSAIGIAFGLVLLGRGMVGQRRAARIAQVPAVFLAGLFGWRAREFFTATEDEQLRPDTALRPT
jgi:hypothetical protein